MGVEEKCDEKMLDWVYEVLSNVSIAMDKASVDKRLSRQLFDEMGDKFNDVLEAFLILVPDVHKEIVVKLVRSYMNWQRSWFK